jgi:hypothetical protein
MNNLNGFSHSAKMDYSLRFYQDKVNEIHKMMINNICSLSQRDIKKYLLDIEETIEFLNLVVFDIADKYNSCKRMLYIIGRNVAENREDDERKKLTKKENITDVMRQTISIKEASNNERYLDELKNGFITRELSPQINCAVKYAKTTDDIPNNYIYWIDDIEQFGIKINNILLRGNIGNIYAGNSDNQRNDKKINITKCKNVLCSKMILSNKEHFCDFYHNPLDIIELYHKGFIDKNDLKRILEHNNIRNYPNNSWLYTDGLRNTKNKHLRHVGNRASLLSDLDLLKYSNNRKKEVEKYMDQTMHDILVVLAMNQKKLI